MQSNNSKQYAIEPFLKNRKDVKFVELKKGETLLPHDELMKYFYIVIKGKIKTYQINFKNSKEQTLSILRDGDMFDTITLLDGRVHEVLYEALEKSKLIQMPIEEVRELLATNREFNQKFFPYMDIFLHYDTNHLEMGKSNFLFQESLCILAL